MHAEYQLFFTVVTIWRYLSCTSDNWNALHVTHKFIKNILAATRTSYDSRSYTIINNYTYKFSRYLNFDNVTNL